MLKSSTCTKNAPSIAISINVPSIKDIESDMVSPSTPVIVTVAVTQPLEPPLGQVKGVVSVTVVAVDAVTVVAVNVVAVAVTVVAVNVVAVNVVAVNVVAVVVNVVAVAVKVVKVNVVAVNVVAVVPPVIVVLVAVVAVSVVDVTVDDVVVVAVSVVAVNVVDVAVTVVTVSVVAVSVTVVDGVTVVAVSVTVVAVDVVVGHADFCTSLIVRPSKSKRETFGIWSAIAKTPEMYAFPAVEVMQSASLLSKLTAKFQSFLSPSARGKVMPSNTNTSFAMM